MKEEDTLNYESRIVAFLDILGFKSLVFREEEEVRRIIRLLDSNLKHVLECLLNDNGDWLSVKLFSDCICMSCDDDPSLLHYVFEELAFVQLYLACEGIFVRGAVSSGKHLENERMIFSEGLIRAYELENRARFPRIVIDDSLIQKIRADDDQHGQGSVPELLLVAPDGCHFIDYLDRIHLGDADWDEEFLAKHKASVLAQVQQNSDNPNILEKYRWVAEYHNFKFGDFFCPDDYYENYFDKLREELVIPLDTFPSFYK